MANLGEYSYRTNCGKNSQTLPSQLFLCGNKNKEPKKQKGYPIVPQKT